MAVTRRAMVLAGAAMTVPLRGQAQGETAAYDLMWAVLAGTADEAGAALATITRDRRADLAAGLILVLRFRPEREREIDGTLRAVTGGKGGDWFGWMLWQEAHPDVVPHPDFIRLMRDINLQIDPEFDGFLRPQFLARDRARIRIEEIAWGGVVKDGIPSLDNPAMIAAGDAGYLRDDDLVFGVAINGDVRAYPLRIMGWHEMFNDTIGGMPVALAYCTLCGAGILFSTRVAGRPRPFVFGSSGFLYRSNKLMFDRQTLTLWNQFTGQPVVGPLADSGIVLDRLPVVIDRWDAWKAANPGTTVLALETGYRRDYGSGVVYRDYFASPDLMFPALADPRLRNKDYVFGIQRFGAAKAWPLAAFAAQPVLNDRVGDLDVVLLGDADSRSVRAYEGGGRTFRAAGAGLTDGTGATWRVTEAALVGPDGTELARVAGQISYWFAWDGYLGDAAELYRP